MLMRRRAALGLLLLPALAQPALAQAETRQMAPDAAVLHDINVSIPAGQTVAMVGATGSGKTTLGRLIARFADPSIGEIRLGEVPLTAVSNDDLRGRLVVVAQEPFLFDDTIYENIRYGKAAATREEIEEAARQARVMEIVESVPQRFETRVGERGKELSGGQRQRIALARVILKNAPVLVLDEATSALDSEVEAAIQSTLDTVMEGKTVIAIAHRLSTIARMDRIVVLDQGRIVEEGTHAGLLARGGLYAGFWRRQSGGFIDVAAE